MGEYVGGYDDWLRQRRPVAPAGTVKTAAGMVTQRPRPERRQSLSYKEQRELDALPPHIETLEAEQAKWYASLSDPSFYRRPGAEIAGAKARLESLERELDDAYRRWEALEGRND